MGEDFVIRALIAGAGVAIAAGALGCFVVWRRMAYFGDSLSHTALAGIPFGLLAGIGIDYGVFAVVVVFSLLLTWAYKRGKLGTDTVLGIIAHGALAIGVVAVSLVNFTAINLHSALFGDILTVVNADIVRIYVCCAVVLALILLNWDSLVLITISEDMAKAEGVRVLVMNFMLVFLMAVMVSASFRIVGALLITSMLIIPAAAARMLARSPEMMAILACAVGVSSVVVGIYGSLVYNTPSGPTIITASVLFFVLFLACGFIYEKWFAGVKN